MTIKLITATTVAFDDAGDFDAAGTRQLFDYLHAAGVRYVFTPGTTAEFTALSDAERLEIIRLALAVFGTEGVYAHVGAAATRQAVQLARAAVAAGATRLAAITPFFVTAGPVSVQEYYRAITEAVPGVAVYVYVFPDRATTEVSPETLAQLATIPGVAGVKLSGMSTDVVATYIAAVPADFEVYSGNDREVVALAARGGAGIVSGISNVYPEVFVDVVDAINAGEDATGRQARIDQVVASVAGGDIRLLKLGVARRGLPAGPARVSVEPPSSDAVARLDETVAEQLEAAR